MDGMMNDKTFLRLLQGLGSTIAAVDQLVGATKKQRTQSDSERPEPTVMDYLQNYGLLHNVGHPGQQQQQESAQAPPPSIPQKAPPSSLPSSLPSSPASSSSTSPSEILEKRMLGVYGNIDNIPNKVKKTIAEMAWKETTGADPDPGLFKKKTSIKRERDETSALPAPGEIPASKELPIATPPSSISSLNTSLPSDGASILKLMGSS